MAVFGAGVVLNLRPSLSPWPVLEARTDVAGPSLQVRYIGTSGLVLSDGRDVVVIDGFVSRPSIFQLLFARMHPDAEAVRAVRHMTGVEELSVIIPTHSHYDHAMDAPEWVKQAGGEVWGSASTHKIALAEGLPDARIVTGGDVFQLGQFEMELFDLTHAPGEMMRGEIGDDFTVPAKVADYRTGGGFGFYFVHGACRILAIPSAGQVNADLKNYPADVVFLSIGQLGLQDADYIADYWTRTVKASGAKLVVPVHWDDFTRPLSKPLKPLPYVVERIDLAMKQISALAGDTVQVALPVLYEPLDLSASGRC